MKKIQLTTKIINKYRLYLFEEERSEATIGKYMRDINKFYCFLDEDKKLSKEILVAFKQHLLQNYKITSVNSMLVAINSLLEYLNLAHFKVKLYKIQRKIFCDQKEELTKDEYHRLLEASQKQNNKRLYMLLQTICATGIRVSELKYITFETLKEGRAIINNKGKIRELLITKKLRVVLNQYCKEINVTQGPIFITRSGTALNRSNIWKMMKNLCLDAKVDAGKVYPHNLRHLFAVTYYNLKKDLVRLADILGHSSIETTRIYTKTSSFEFDKLFAKMELIEMWN